MGTRRLALPSLLAVAAFLSVAGVLRAGDFIFAGYNLEDYFQAADFPDGREKVSKSQESIDAEIHVIRDIHPDVLGVCEMGPPNEFQSFRALLKAAGLDYPDVEYVQGPDPERHVALLSKFPIVARQSVVDAPFELNGREEKIRRGILDVTVDAPGGKLRFIGVHLKSKLRDTPENEEELRRNEAHLLREHIDQALAGDAGARLIVYGDFNDTRNAPAMREVAGPRKTPQTLYDLNLKDSLGDYWTEHWKYQDVYSRIDYIFVTHNLFHSVNFGQSYIYRSPYWEEASDHRPVVASFHMEEAQ